MRPRYEVADIIRQFGSPLINQGNLSGWQIKTLLNILHCRTAYLGGHKEVCNCCGNVKYSYSSCGNRHCPKCQFTKQVKWIDKLINKTLPIKHYHIVFTLPHCLNAVALWNNTLYYKILFKTAWQVLHSFGYSHYGCETGTVAVLHTWGQNLSFHPHLHCIVPAAGYTLHGKWKNIGINGLYLYPVHQISQAFKYRFLACLKQELKKQKVLSGFNHLIQKAYKKNWVVYCEPPLANANGVIKYLGQYTHRVAISNQSILKVTKTHVQFMAKNYRNNASKKAITLTGFEFLRRYCQHILPSRFVKIRYYGIYNSTTKRSLNLQFQPETINELEQKIKLKNETAQECIKRLFGIDLNLCPVCKTGIMQKVQELPKIRSPSKPLQTLIHDILK